MSTIILGLGVLASSFSCIMISLSLRILGKRVTHIEDDNSRLDRLLALSFIKITQIEEKQKNYEERN